MVKILVLSDFYLPGYRGGGPIRSIANLIEGLGDEFQFKVICFDRDLGDKRPFENIVRNDWQHVGKAQVRYISPGQMKPWFIRKLLNATDYDLIYLNSYFSVSTIIIMLLSRLGLISDRPIVLAPRGQFSKGALELKWIKKQSYILMSKTIGLYKGVIWQASSDWEEKDIRTIYGRAHTFVAANLNIKIAPDMPDRTPGLKKENITLIKESGAARAVFISRISRKKNLDYALKILAGQEGKIEFDIYGPIEDEEYWNECWQLIDSLPENVRVSHLGELHPDEVRDTFSRYHVFLFPTRGENFGHVILESLSAGCPVLTSDQTPWRDLIVAKAGWDLPISSSDGFQEALDELVSMDKKTFAEWYAGAHRLAEKYLSTENHKEANRRLFNEALKTDSSRGSVHLKDSVSS